MTQKELNKILTILERRRDHAMDYWLKAMEHHISGREYWQGQMIGLDLSIQEIKNSLIAREEQ